MLRRCEYGNEIEAWAYVWKRRAAGHECSDPEYDGTWWVVMSSVHNRRTKKQMWLDEQKQRNPER